MIHEGHIGAGRTSARSARRRMSIVDALTWAFCTERAQLDFDQYGAHEFAREGIDPIWRGMQMATLGCAVDGGGSSDPHHDATIIVGAVEALSVGSGGRRMALQIAEFARARSGPNWRGQGRLACVPAESLDICERGMFLTGNVRSDGSLWVWRDKWRKRQERRGQYCAVTYTGTAASIAAARRNYLAWIGALYELQANLRQALHSIELTDEFPPLSPWRDEG